MAHPLICSAGIKACLTPMKRGLTGHYVPLPSATGENARAFVPNPLPPRPPLELDAEIQELIEKAMLALGRLDGLTTSPPFCILRFSIPLSPLLKSQRDGMFIAPGKRSAARGNRPKINISLFPCFAPNAF